MPSFNRVLQSVSDAYRERKEAISETAAQLRQIYNVAVLPAVASGALSQQTLELAYRGLARSYDIRNGGFGGAPKFPPTMSLDFLLRYWKRTGTQYALDMVTESFRKMSRGGLYDQVGGGFHRYTVDAVWLVPHFEKMLYDNALLVRLGAHLWQATGDNEVRRVTMETITWLEREMTSPQGGFYSSLDADSEGHEGKFYVWSEAEIDSLLGTDATVIKTHFGISSGGNFEGQNIANIPTDSSATASRNGISVDELRQRVEKAKKLLYAERAKRVWPGRDDKILAGWNGLMLRGVATAARVFGDPAHFRLAIANGEFLNREMIRDGRAMRSHKNGESRIAGFLEDHAAVALGFISLYELTFDPVWFERAFTLAQSVIERFWDDENGMFFDTAADAEQLITRPHDVTDNAMPSGSSLAVELMLILSELSGDQTWRDRAMLVLESNATALTKYPSAFGHLLGAADLALHGAVEVAIAGDLVDPGFRLLEREVAAHYVPSLVLAGGNADSGIALLEGRRPVAGLATAYVCKAYTCDEPVSDPGRLARQLENAGPAHTQSSTEV